MKKRKAIHQKPGEGRAYDLGRVQSIFKVDEPRYSISEWWLDPHTRGPGAHSHPEDDTFYVLEGTISFLIGRKWIDCPKGSFVVAPGGVKHDFENRTGKRAGMINFCAPGAFEVHMPGIAEWFRNRPDARI